VVDAADGTNPEHEALLADSVGLALLVVLETLSPAERLTFVLHDMFAMPFEQIAPIVERSPEATRQLASRARRRVRGTAPVPDASITEQWKLVDAFLASARNGDFEALVAVLDPDVVLRADGGMTGLSHHVQGAEAVASQATMWARAGLTARRALVNGAAGLVSERHGKAFSVGAFTIKDGRSSSATSWSTPSGWRGSISKCSSADRRPLLQPRTRTARASASQFGRRAC
jgi:ketosteroid isomerase-like protein